MASWLDALYLQLHPSVCLCRCWHCCPTTACLRTGRYGVCRTQTVEDRAAMARDGSMEHPAPLLESLCVYCRESCYVECWAHANSEPALEVIKPLRWNPDLSFPKTQTSDLIRLYLTCTSLKLRVTFYTRGRPCSHVEYSVNSRWKSLLLNRTIYIPRCLLKDKRAGFFQSDLCTVPDFQFFFQLSSLAGNETVDAVGAGVELSHHLSGFMPADEEG